MYIIGAESFVPDKYFKGRVLTSIHDWAKNSGVQWFLYINRYLIEPATSYGHVWVIQIGLCDHVAREYMAF